MCISRLHSHHVPCSSVPLVDFAPARVAFMALNLTATNPQCQRLAHQQPLTATAVCNGVSYLIEFGRRRLVNATTQSPPPP